MSFFSDLPFIFQWWATLFLIGLVFFPFTVVLFNKFFDNGYLFSKILAAILISYVAYILGLVHILRFSSFNLYLILFLFACLNLYLIRSKVVLKIIKPKLRIIIFEEVMFFLTLAAWSFVRAHEPSIHGLEKYMDFGFVNSILRSEYFPPQDMWFAGEYINYYYFGHLVSAVLTKLSLLPSSVTYNLMIATIFAFTFCLSFSLGIAFLTTKFAVNARVFVSGILSGALVALGGNLHALYSFFSPYQNEQPQPLWQLQFLPESFPNSYWYPNATRFIPFTIHEFPIYSFVVSDLHGHVIDIPFVLFSIALIFTLFIDKTYTVIRIILLSLFLAIMYMTNTWDALIYMGLSLLVLGAFALKHVHIKKRGASWHKKLLSIHMPRPGVYELLRNTLLLIAGFLLFIFPFNFFFKPFVSGIGVVCAPEFLVNMGKLGPFLFEADHCQQSELYQLFMLHGFFLIFAVAFFIFIFVNSKYQILKTDIFMLFLVLISLLLIITPEFLYAKDIYPAHYRANTMFKLVYQSFIMLSLVSAYVIAILMRHIRIFVLHVGIVMLVCVVLIYPYFAVDSYYGHLQNYKGIDGITYLKDTYPEDYDAIIWIQKNIPGQPVLLEAQGDSYTDYERISSHTGLPTVLGWTVHEWLWRSDYSVPAPRIEDVRALYESPDILLTQELINKYEVSYVYVGTLERQKYPTLNEQKFEQLGTVVFQKNNSKLYKLY